MIKTTSKRLLESVNQVGSLVKTPSTIPALENLFISVKDSVMYITANNLEVGATAKLNVESESDISACVPYEVFSRMLKVIPDSPIELVFKKAEMEILYPGSCYSIPRIDTEGYPERPVIEDGMTMTVKGADFAEKLSKSVVFVDESRIDALVNVLIVIQKDKCIVATFNNHSGIESTIVCKSDNAARLLLKKSSAKYLQEVLAAEEEVTFSWNEKLISVSSEDIDVSITLAEGNYPANYAKVFDIDAKNKLMVEPSLLSCLKRMGTIADKDNSTIKLDLSPDKMKVSLVNSNYNYQGHEELAVSYTGEPMLIAFNLNYLKSSLQSFPENVLMSFETARKQVVIDAHDSRGMIAPVLLASNE